MPTTKLHLLQTRNLIIGNLSTAGFDDVDIASIMNINKSTVGRILRRRQKRDATDSKGNQ